MDPRLTRRTALKTAGALGLGVATGGNFAVNAAASGDDRAFIDQLGTVVASTYEYRDIDAAREDGYEEFGVNPKAGHAYLKSDYWDEAKYVGPTDITEPPSLLLYAPVDGEGDGGDPGLVLGAVEYHVSGDRTTDPPDLFADEEASGELTVTEAEGWHRAPDPDAIDATGIHVWAHFHNPAGLFNLGNPIVERMVGD